jgi:hypothetical protein
MCFFKLYGYKRQRATIGAHIAQVIRTFYFMSSPNIKFSTSGQYFPLAILDQFRADRQFGEIVVVEFGACMMVNLPYFSGVS